jgi:PIN domain nuclease of toxin-antitoxin system
LRLLLDTHALIWWLIDSPKLSRPAHAAISDGRNEILVSAASAMEVTTKYRRGKLPEAEPLAAAFEREVASEGFTPLAITVAHAAVAGALPMDHKDPFDRLLIAQTQIEDAVLVSNEKLFDGFGVSRLW